MPDWPGPDDEAAANESLARQLLGGENVFLATALYQLECGHVRPMNAALEIGASIVCLSCQSEEVIVAKQPIEPTEYPTPDAMRDVVEGPG